MSTREKFEGYKTDIKRMLHEAGEKTALANVDRNHRFCDFKAGAC